MKYAKLLLLFSFLILSSSTRYPEKKRDYDLKEMAPAIQLFNPSFIEIVPEGKPVIEKYHVTSTFGMRNHPILGIKKQHTGVDFRAPKGAKIMSTAEGEVITAMLSGRKKDGSMSTYGKHVIVDHGCYTTLYAHLDTIYVRKGDILDFREYIGEVGSTGRSTGNHLHYEIRKEGVLVDPVEYL